MIPGNLLTIEGVINVENRKMKINLGVCPGVGITVWSYAFYYIDRYKK